MTVIMPADYHACKQLVREAVDKVGPVYMRFTRDAVPMFYPPYEPFEIGKAKVLKEGHDITLIANGDMLYQALSATKQLEALGISVRLLDMHTIKPLDRQAVINSVQNTGKVISIEDHNIINGLGSAVAEVMAEIGGGILRRVGLNDRFGESGPYQALLEKFEMDDMAIVKQALSLLSMEEA